MGSYKIQWKRSAEKDLRRVSQQYIPRILEAINALSQDPFPPKHRKLIGTDSSYRIRIGDYRAVYQVDTETCVIVVFHVRHRKDVYRK